RSPRELRSKTAPLPSAVASMLRFTVTAALSARQWICQRRIGRSTIFPDGGIGGRGRRHGQGGVLARGAPRPGGTACRGARAGGDHQLRRPDGREIFLKLAARADAVVENFRPGTLARWGVGYADVRRVKPDIVYVSISGFGQWGPGHDRPGYDPIVEAESGFMARNGEPDGEPMRCATYIGDDVAGLHGALAALA